jgi:hypothetical protein
VSTAESRIPRGLGRSGALVAVGLAVEAISMYWAHPTSFLLFAFVGGGLVAAGVLVYLWTIARG